MQGGMREHSRVMNMFCISPVVLVLWMYTFIKTHQMVHFRSAPLHYMQFSSHIKIKLSCFKKCMLSL